MRKKRSSRFSSTRIPEEGSRSPSTANSDDELPFSDEQEEEEELSSDEEFYVHAALQGLRKSKSSAAGFSTARSSTGNYEQTATITSLKRRSSQKVSYYAVWSPPPLPPHRRLEQT